MPCFAPTQVPAGAAGCAGRSPARGDTRRKIFLKVKACSKCIYRCSGIFQQKPSACPCSKPKGKGRLSRCGAQPQRHRPAEGSQAGSTASDSRCEECKAYHTHTHSGRHPPAIWKQEEISFFYVSINTKVTEKSPGECQGSRKCLRAVR